MDGTTHLIVVATDVSKSMDSIGKLALDAQGVPVKDVDGFYVTQAQRPYSMPQQLQAGSFPAHYLQEKMVNEYVQQQFDNKAPNDKLVVQLMTFSGYAGAHTSIKGGTFVFPANAPLELEHHGTRTSYTPFDKQAFIPRGNYTAVNDSLAQCLEQTAEYAQSIHADTTLIYFLTDGVDNCSRITQDELNGRRKVYESMGINVLYVMNEALDMNEGVSRGIPQGNILRVQFNNGRCFSHATHAVGDVSVTYRSARTTPDRAPAPPPSFTPLHRETSAPPHRP